MSSTAKFGPQFVWKSGYGDRNDPRNPAIREFHPGIDAVAPAGTEIQSVSGGRIIYSGYNAGLGNVIIVRNADGTGSLYAHMRDRPSLTFGEQIEEGNIVGRVGNTGTASRGVHLHFSLLSENATNAIEKAQKKSNYAGGPLSILLKEFLDDRPMNVLDPAALLDQIPLPRARPDLGDPRNSDQRVAPLAESSLNFNDRFSAIYSPAATPIGDGKGIGSLPDIAATYDGGGRVGNSSPMVAPDFVGPDIPFVSRPNGSLAAPGGSSLLDPAPMDPGAPGPFSTGGRFAPRSLPPQPLYPTGALVPTSNGRVYDRQGLLDDRSGYGNPTPTDDTDRFRSPVLRELQRYRQLAASGVAVSPSSAASSPDIPLASGAIGSGAAAPRGGVLKWIGNGLIGSAEASQSNLLPLGGVAPGIVGENDGSIPDANEAASPLAPDNRRYLSRRIAGQASAFDTGAPAVSFVPSNETLSPDRSNSFDDRFGNRGSAPSMAQFALPQQASRPLGLFTGQPMPDWPVSLPIFGFPDRSSGHGGSADDRGLGRSQVTGIPFLDEYIRYLNREYPI